MEQDFKLSKGEMAAPKIAWVEQLGLQDLLRHVLPGVVALASLAAVYPAARLFLIEGKIEQSSPGIYPSYLVAIDLGLIVLIGTLVYALHRALSYPLLGWLSLMISRGLGNFQCEAYRGSSVGKLRMELDMRW